MDTQTLQAEVREGRGKGPARRLRSEGKIPAVFYGPGTETKTLAVSPKELLKALATPYGKNVVLSLSMGGDPELAMVKDVQVHPVGRHPLHVDFYRVAFDREVAVDVPLTMRGRALGVQKGGLAQAIFRSLPVQCTPDKIPAKIEVDVTPLDMGDYVTVAQLELPAGVRVLFPADRRVVLVGEERRRAPEEEAAPGAAAATAAATPAAAAPAAKAAAPAKGGKGSK